MTYIVLIPVGWAIAYSLVIAFLYILSLLLVGVSYLLGRAIGAAFKFDRTVATVVAIPISLVLTILGFWYLLWTTYAQPYGILDYFSIKSEARKIDDWRGLGSIRIGDREPVFGNLYISEKSIRSFNPKMECSEGYDDPEAHPGNVSCTRSVLIGYWVMRSYDKTVPVSKYTGNEVAHVSLQEYITTSCEVEAFKSGSVFNTIEGYSRIKIYYSGKMGNGKVLEEDSKGIFDNGYRSNDLNDYICHNYLEQAFLSNEGRVVAPAPE